MAAVGLAEGLARLHGDRLCIDASGVFYQADSRFGWQHVPGLAGFVERCRGTYLPPVSFEVNGQGLLDLERTYGKPPGTARLLLLGGNLPEGLGVRDPFTMGRLLEQHADRRRGRALEVINAGIGGFALDNALLFFRHEGVRYVPDLVLLVVNPSVEVPSISPDVLRAMGRPVPAKPYLRLEDGRLVVVEPPPAPPAPVPPGGLLVHSQLWRLVGRLPSRVGPPFTHLPDAGERPDLGVARAAAEELARRILEALRDEVAATGGRLVVVVAPASAGSERALAQGEVENAFIQMAHRLDLPVTSLGPAFRHHFAHTGRFGYLPQLSRWNRDGHLIAAENVWNFLVANALLPDGVEPVAALGGGRVPEPARFVEDVWRARHALFPTWVQVGLLAVALVWVGTVLPAHARDWWLVAVGAGVMAALATPRFAAGALALALVFRGLVERLPRLPAVAGAAGALAALLVWPVVHTPQWVPLYDADAREYVAAMTGVAWLRLAAYAADRLRGTGARPPLRTYLGGLLFFPTTLNGPIETVHDFAERRPVGGVAPATFAALGAHLAGSGRALLRLGLGVVKVHAARLLVATLTPDVFASGGDAVGRLRLWLWALELPLLFWLALSGLTDVAVGLGRMVGARVTENFDAPWRARDPGDFWRRVHVSLGAWLRAYVYRPLGGGTRDRTVHVLAVFVAAGLWYAWGALKLFGPAVFRPSALAGFLVWGLANGGVVAWLGRRAGARATPVSGWRRALAAMAGAAFVAASSVPFFLPPWNGLGDAARVVLRLGGLR